MINSHTSGTPKSLLIYCSSKLPLNQCILPIVGINSSVASFWLGHNSDGHPSSLRSQRDNVMYVIESLFCMSLEHDAICKGFCTLIVWFLVPFYHCNHSRDYSQGLVESHVPFTVYTIGIHVPLFQNI